MDIDLTNEDLALQFLVQEVLQDLGRYYERNQQRTMYRQSLEGVKKDVEEYVVQKYVTQHDEAHNELDNIFEAVSDQLDQTNAQDSVKIKAYLDVFDEWCHEQLNTGADEVLEAGTEGKPEATKWLEFVRDNIRSLDEGQIDSELRKEFQNKLIARWNEIYEKISDLLS